MMYVDKLSILKICHTGKFNKRNKFNIFVHFGRLYLLVELGIRYVLQLDSPCGSGNPSLTC